MFDVDLFLRERRQCETISTVYDQRAVIGDIKRAAGRLMYLAGLAISTSERVGLDNANSEYAALLCLRQRLLDAYFNRRYSTDVAASRENGKKGGRPKKRVDNTRKPC